MLKPFLLSRVLLQFNSDTTDLLNQMSAVAVTPDGSLWMGSDELASLERLSPQGPCEYSEHQSFAIANYLDIADPSGEVDIEGIDYSKHYLWFTGSHSSKRKKTKGKKPEKDIRKLATVETQPNRYLMGRIPIVNGELFRSCSHPGHSEKKLTAACLETDQHTNILIEALKEDVHLGPFVTISLPSKENGFDIEGLAVHGDRLFLGLRGPVLRGWAIILDIEVEEKQPGILTLKAIGKEGQPYRKHFVYLNGLGIRELCLQGKDLLILAGPTMSLEGAMQVFRLTNALDLDSDSLCDEESGHLKVVFDLPFTMHTDHAEGLALFSCLNQPEGLLVVYDAPDPIRKVAPNAIFADVFRLN